MAVLDGWDLNRYRDLLLHRARDLHIDPRVNVRFDASDLVQETLLRASDPAREPCVGTSDEERLAWLFRIQERLLLDKYDEQFSKKRDLHREVDLAAMRGAFGDSTAEYTPEYVDPGPSPSETAAAREEGQVLIEYIARLPPEYRAVLQLRREGLTVAEIAERLGVGIGVASGRIAQASKRLAKLTENLRGGYLDG